MAFLPSPEHKLRGRGNALARPRFLAISEFGPHSLIYHEGRAYRVEGVILDATSASTDEAAAGSLNTRLLRLCSACGYGTFGDADSVCAGCGQALDQPDEVRGVLAFNSVAARPKERITANDEARQRQGFDIPTTFEWATRKGAPDVESAAVVASSGVPLLTLSYGATARLTRFNRGLRRRDLASPPGFFIDPARGTWLASNAKKGADSKKAGGQQADDAPDVQRERVVPAVEERENVLWVRPECAAATDQTLPTLQHALLRALHLHFGLEEGEVQAEPMPSAAHRRGFLLYETSQGGAGVLRRLVRDGTALAAVADVALAVMHLVREAPNAARVDTAPGCVAGCYRCLLSYFNQQDHGLIDRRDPAVTALLEQLALPNTRIVGRDTASAEATAASTMHATAAQPDESAAAPQAALSAVDSELRAALREYLLPDPDPQPLQRGAVSLPYAWREHRVVMAVAGDAATAPALAQLGDEGFDVVSLDPHARASWDAGLTTLAALLGRQP